jgi:proteasome alpha subunit
MRGYAYDRRDVTGRGLANAYAQTLGTIFSSGGEKPYEVEIFVAEVGDTADDDQVYRLTYDGQVADEHGFAVMGGSAEQATAYLKDRYQPGTGLEDSIRLAVEALGQGGTETRTIPSGNLEVAVLDRTRTQQRKFRRMTADQLSRILGNGGPSGPSEGDGEPGGSGGGSTDPYGPDRHRQRRTAAGEPAHRRARRATGSPACLLKVALPGGLALLWPMTAPTRRATT